MEGTCGINKIVESFYSDGKLVNEKVQDWYEISISNYDSSMVRRIYEKTKVFPSLKNTELINKVSKKCKRFKDLSEFLIGEVESHEELFGSKEKIMIKHYLKR